MPTTTLEDLFSQPAFLCIFLTILVTIANVIIGVGILPDDKRKKRYKLHRNVYWAVMAVFSVFLWFNYRGGSDSLLSYIVFLYFAIVIPWSRKINVTAHSILASIGLVFLTLVAILLI
jgi:hypothetical protein